MTTMINTATSFEAKIDWILVGDESQTLNTDKIDYPLDYPLSLRGVRSAIADFYKINTSEIKIVNVDTP